MLLVNLNVLCVTGYRLIYLLLLKKHFKEFSISGRPNPIADLSKHTPALMSNPCQLNDSTVVAATYDHFS
jgi:hypothetical protein